MNFDRLAPCYRALEFLAAGNQLHHRQTQAHHLLHTDLWIRDNSCDGRQENCRTF